jgi:hypothetical protein
MTAVNEVGTTCGRPMPTGSLSSQNVILALRGTTAWQTLS